LEIPKRIIRILSALPIKLRAWLYPQVGRKRFRDSNLIILFGCGRHESNKSHGARFVK